MKVKALNIYLTSSQKRILKEESERLGISMSGLVKNLINSHFFEVKR